MTLDIYNDITRLFVALLNVVMFGWLGYWAFRFYCGRRRGENGITTALALFFVALSIDRLWLIAGAIYRIFPEYPPVSAAFETVRLVILVAGIGSLAFVTWRFIDDKEHRGQDSQAGDSRPQ